MLFATTRALWDQLFCTRAVPLQIVEVGVFPDDRRLQSPVLPGTVCLRAIINDQGTTLATAEGVARTTAHKRQRAHEQEAGEGDHQLSNPSGNGADKCVSQKVELCAKASPAAHSQRLQRCHQQLNNKLVGGLKP